MRVAMVSEHASPLAVLGGVDAGGQNVHVAALAEAMARQGAEVAGPPREEVLDLAGATTLAQLAEVLAAADCVVVGNTGPAHLAAAVGAPVVSLFAPTVPAARWRPWGVPLELLHVDVPCAGCRARDCPVPGHPCLGGVGEDDVVAAVARLAPVGALA